MNQSLVSELAQLIDEWNLGTLGTDIFIGEVPDGIEEAFMVVDAPSPEPHRYVDTQYRVVDFWYKSAHAAKAYQKMDQLFNLLFRRSQYSTANWYIYFSNPLGNTVDLDRNQEGSKLLRLSVQFYCRNLSDVS